MWCWNDFCIASDCNGVNHLDASGHTWEEKKEIKKMTELEKALELLRKLVFIDECHYDHDRCLAHMLHPKPCPHEEAKELLETHNIEWLRTFGDEGKLDD